MTVLEHFSVCLQIIKANRVLCIYISYQSLIKISGIPTEQNTEKKLNLEDLYYAEAETAVPQMNT